MPRADPHIKVTVGKPKRKGARKKGNRTAERETKVSVNGWPVRVGVLRLAVYSSDQYKLRLPREAWSNHACTRVGETLQEGGRKKGRVLYLMNEATGAVVAVLGFHVQSSQELHVRFAESAEAVKDREAALVTALLTCLEKILNECPGERPKKIVWLASRAEASAIRQNHNFKLGRPEAGRVRLERQAP